MINILHTLHESMLLLTNLLKYIDIKSCSGVNNVCVFCRGPSCSGSVGGGGAGGG